MKMNRWLERNRSFVVTLGGSLAVLGGAIPFAVKAGRAATEERREEQCVYALKSASAAFAGDWPTEVRAGRVSTAARLCQHAHDVDLAALQTDLNRAVECDRLLNSAKAAISTQPVDVETYLSNAAHQCGTVHEEEIARIRNAAHEAVSLSDTIQTLWKISRNPLALKPEKVSPPDQVEDHTTYEYAIPGVGDVVQSRTDGQRWSIFLSGKTTPDFFAPPIGLRPLVNLHSVQWWRVISGPFEGGFVLRTPGGIEVRSKEDVCSVGEGLPQISKECASH